MGSFLHAAALESPIAPSFYRESSQQSGRFQVELRGSDPGSRHCGLRASHVGQIHEERVGSDGLAVHSTVLVAGMVIGLCGAVLLRAHAVHPITAVQSEYSLWTRDPEDGVLSTVRRLGIGLVAYSPLGRGFLSGQIRSVDDLDADDYRRSNPRFQSDNFIRNLDLVDRVRDIAMEKDVTPPQLALAWVLSRGDDIVPIPGTTKRRHLTENIGALDIVLTPAELDRIESAFPKGAAAGARYANMSRLSG